MHGDCFFLARPPQPVIERILAALARHGLQEEGRTGLFPSANWHQSLSNLHGAVSGDALKRIGDGVRATQVELVFNRIGSHVGPQGRIQWTLKARGSQPAGFAALLADLRAGVARAGLEPGAGHTPHVTLHYHAPHALDGSLAIESIHWTIDTLELVRIAGPPYRYDTLARWPLAPPAQQALF